MTTILLARHAETSWNRERRWQGHADPPLNELGREQARALAERLVGERVGAVYASDLRRASETARIVGERLALGVVLDPALREVDVGEWSGLSHDEVRARYPDGYARWRAGAARGWERGEEYAEMHVRVLAALHRIAAAHPSGRVLVVSHGGPIRAVQHEAARTDGLELRSTPSAIENCGVYVVELGNGALRPVD